MHKVILAYETQTTPVPAGTDFASTFKLSLLDALYLVRTAWSAVTKETIANCFRHAGFGLQSSACDAAGDAAVSGTAEFNATFESAVAVTGAETTADDYRAVDENLTTSAILSVAEITIQATGKNDDNDSEEEEEDETDVENIPITAREAGGFMDKLKSFVMQYPNSEHVLDQLDKLSDFVRKCEAAEKKQKKIVDFFKTV